MQLNNKEMEKSQVKDVKENNALKKAGIKAENKNSNDKRWLAEELMNGFETVSDFIIGGVCYDAAAYVAHLLHPDLITCSDLENKHGQHWVTFFDQNFEYRRFWKGENINKGNVVIFIRNEEPFHAAIAVGGTFIRAVNGGLLGMAWSYEVNLKTVLKERLASGAYKYDNSEIKVLIYARSVL